MGRIAMKCRVMALVFALAAASYAQQVGAPLSKQAAAVKRKAEHLAPRAPISVVRIDADEEFGEFVSHDDETFTFFDIDGKTAVTLRYADVRKIKDGYGGYNSTRGQHTDRSKTLIVTVIVLGAIGGLLAAVATAKN